MSFTGKHTELIRQMDHKSNADRFAFIIWRLKTLDVFYEVQEYKTGRNIMVDLSFGRIGKKIGISSHYDIVKGSGGANDNGSAVAVCLEIIRRYIEKKQKPCPVRIFFFDQEEDNLQGSTAYVNKHGIDDMQALINMELVGAGNQFALWPVPPGKSTPVLAAFEKTVSERQALVTRFDQIVTNTADHLPFLQKGLEDSFTITCISEGDLKSAVEYFQALSAGEPFSRLQQIFLNAPAFVHYHRPTDTYDNVNDRSIEMTASFIWDTLMSFSGIKAIR